MNRGALRIICFALDRDYERKAEVLTCARPDAGPHSPAH